MLEPEHKDLLQNLAISLSSNVGTLLGKGTQRRLLITPSNMAPQFIEVRLGPRAAKRLKRQQAARVTTAQATVLSGSLGVIYEGELTSSLNTAR